MGAPARGRQGIRPRSTPRTGASPTLCDQLIAVCPVPDPCRSHEQAERYYMRDIPYLDAAMRDRELAVVQILLWADSLEGRLDGTRRHWYELREAALLRRPR